MLKALSAIVTLLAAQPVLANSIVPPRPAPLQPAVAPPILNLGTDPFSRMTVPISLNGETHRFLIDSGSERTAIATELAGHHGMVPTGTVLVTGLAGKSWVPTVVVPSMGFARSSRRNFQALLFSRYAMGADGFLGADMLAQQLVDFDFANNRMTLRRAPSIPGPPSFDSTLFLKARQHKGRLVFAYARAGRVPIRAVLDTGSSISIGNGALRQALARRKRLGPTIPVTLIAVTGEPVQAELAIAREVVIGDAIFRNLPIAFATVQPFVQLGYVEEPAMLVGMDALRAFDRVAVDFRNKRVSFTLKTSLGKPNLNIRGVAW